MLRGGAGWKSRGVEREGGVIGNEGADKWIGDIGGLIIPNESCLMGGRSIGNDGIGGEYAGGGGGAAAEALLQKRLPPYRRHKQKMIIASANTITRKMRPAPSVGACTSIRWKLWSLVLDSLLLVEDPMMVGGEIEGFD